MQPRSGWTGASSLGHRPEREARGRFTCATGAQPCPYLRAKAFGEILHAAQRGTQVDIVAVQEDAQQGMGGTGIGDQLEGDTKTILTSKNKTPLQQPLRVDNNQVKSTDMRTTCESSNLTSALKGREVVGLVQRATPRRMSTSSLCRPRTGSQPSLDSLQRGAQPRDSQERQAALRTIKSSMASQYHVASLRCHTRHPSPLPPPLQPTW